MRDAYQWALWSAVFGVVMALVANPKRKGQRACGRQTLTYPPVLSVLGIICSVFFLLLGAYSWLADVPGATVAVLLMFCSAAALTAFGAFYCHRVCYEIREDGIHLRHGVGPAEFLAWTDITDVRFVVSLVLYRQAGRRIEFTTFLIGLSDLASAISERVPANRIDPLARSRLQELVDEASS